MSTTYHKFLIAFAVMILVGGLYTYFSNGLSSEAATPIVTDSSVSSSSGVAATSPASQSQDDKIAEDTAFLATLTSLTKIKIDPTIFMNSGFLALRDNTVQIENTGTTGRANPFAPIDANFGMTVQVQPVITGEATQITNKTAILNGSTTATGVTSSYFEYGPTATLGKSTVPSAQSLVGTFTSKITGLTPKTTYFFRAVAKANGLILTGDVGSFNTN